MVMWRRSWIPFILLSIIPISTTRCSTLKIEEENQKALWVQPVVESDEEWAIAKLKAAGISVPIQNLITTKKPHLPDPFEKIIHQNVLGFLYAGDYFVHDSLKGENRAREYLTKYARTFALAEKKFQVQREAIAALLWVETKFGKYLGTLPIAQVYFQILKADHPIWIQKTWEEMLKQKPDADFAMHKKCVERAKAKSAWALEQLVALSEMQKTAGLQVYHWRGSFAGAFGISQFIPSSYLKYAQSANVKMPPNLFHHRDAIVSVANFLKTSGWKDDSIAAQTAALYEYNRSKDYGAVILRIRDRLRGIPLAQP